MRQIALDLQESGLYTSSTSNAEAGEFVIRIAYHIVTIPGSSGNFPIGTLPAMTQALNDAWAGSGLTFCYRGDVDLITDLTYLSVDNIVEADQLRDINPVGGAINVYIVDNIFIDGFQLAGLSSFTFSPVQGIILDRDFTPHAGQFSTWPHEVGHYLDLFHTHEQFIAGCENPNGSNCAIAGDLICDTPADPNLLSPGVTVSGNPGCAFITGPGYFPCVLGQVYTPPTRNYMSFAPQDCRVEFTQGQFERARSTFLNLRPELQTGGCFADPDMLNAFDPDAGDEFGRSVAVSRSNNLGVAALLVGAPNDDDGGTDAGAVYVFESIGASGWGQDEKLIPNGVMPGDQFGTSLAYDGFTAMVGASKANTATGYVHVFERQGQFWSDHQRLTEPTAGAGDQFGTSVDVHGDWAVAGSPRRDTSVVEGGAVTFFERTAAYPHWVRHSLVTASDESLFGQFGQSVSISGNIAVVGSPGAFNTAPIQGAVYVFEYDGNQWTEVQKLSYPGTSLFSRFGSAVSVYGDTLLVGAPEDDTAAINAGQAFFFRRNNQGFWALEHSTFAIAPADNDAFGSSVALAGNAAIIGAPNTGVVLTTFSGAAYRFSRTSSGWRVDERIRPPFLGADDQFGLSVAIENDVSETINKFAIGAHSSNIGGVDAGITMAYESIPFLSGLLMTTDIQEVSVTAGGTQVMSLSAGSGQIGEAFIVLGSITGTSPGFVVGPNHPNPTNPFVVKDDSFVLPLVQDPYFNLTLQNPTGGFLTNSLGILDSTGSATTTLNVPGGGSLSGLIGLTVYHSFVLPGDLFFASNTASLLLVP